MIVVLWGVSGCGKTTVGQQVALALDWSFFDADDFHPESNVRKMRGGTPLTDEDRWPWLDHLAQMMLAEIEQGRNAVLACSALKRVYRQRLCVDAEQMRFVHLRGEFALIAQRIGARDHEFMHNDLLQSQFDTLEPEEGGLSVDVRASTAELCREIIQLVNQT